MASVNCNTPPTLNIASGNIAENFRKWKQQVQVFIMAAGLSSASKERRTAVILNFAGEDVLEIYNHFVFATGEDKDDPEVVMKRLRNIVPQRFLKYMKHISSGPLHYRNQSIILCLNFAQEPRTVTSRICRIGLLEIKLCLLLMIMPFVTDYLEKLTI